MNRLDWEPLTPDQLGAVMHEFERLGFDPRRDRAMRLAVCAALLGLSRLSSVHDLRMGQAGQLLRMLRGFPDRASLAAALPRPEPRPDPVPLAVRSLLGAVLAGRQDGSHGDHELGQLGNAAGGISAVPDDL